MIGKLRNRITLLIAAGNLLIFVLLIVTGLAVMGSMRHLSAITTSLYEHPFKVNNAAQVAKFKIEHIRDHMLEIALSRDSKRLQNCQRSWQSWTAVRDNFAVVEAGFLGDVEKVKETHRLLDEWRDARIQTIDLAKRGQWPQVQKLVMTGNREIFARLDDDVDYIVAFTRFRADAFVKEANSEAATAINRIVWLLASFAGLIFLIGLGISRRTWRLMRAEEKAATAVAQAEKSYRSLFENMLEGYVHGQLIYDRGMPCDFTFLAVNSSFQKLMRLEDVIGKRQ